MFKGASFSEILGLLVLIGLGLLGVWLFVEVDKTTHKSLQLSDGIIIPFGSFSHSRSMQQPYSIFNLVLHAEGAKYPL